MNYKLKIFLLLIMISHSLIPGAKINIAPGINMDAKDYFEFVDIIENKKIKVKYNQETQNLEEKNYNASTNDNETLVKDLSLEPIKITSFDIKQFVQNTKYPLIISGTILSIYGYFILKLYSQVLYIKNTDTWSCFKKNVPIEALYEIPENKFLHDLIVIIYRTFDKSQDNPNYDDIEPLYLFIKAAHKEIKQLESFINLYWYLKLPIISILFPNLDDELTLAQEKIEKLSYMQDLVTNKIRTLNS